MKTYLTILGIVAVATFASGQALGQATEDGTLYDQEGTSADGYSTIDAFGDAPGTVTNPQTENWKYQYGGGSYSGVYKGANGWLDISDVGDSTIDIECDIEMYYEETFDSNKIYFHIGNPFTATEADKTAIVNGQFKSNNGMYIGISFDETGKSPDDMLQDGGEYTGEVQDAMVGTIDVLGRDISAESFNAKFSLSWSADGTNWSDDETPVTFGTGTSGTELNVLWWLVNEGQKGEYQVKYKIEMLPAPDQADGNYVFDPEIVASPVL